MLKNFNSIFLDFDGTITKQDTVGTFFMQFAGKKWVEIENDWIKGKISSKECMLLQLKTIENLTEEKLYNYLDSIELQDGFMEFCKTAQDYGKKIIIISDGFDLFISRILKNYGLLNLDNIEFLKRPLAKPGKILSTKTPKNKETLTEKETLKFHLSFPNEQKACRASLGNCKCACVKSHITKNEFLIFAGDGLSDRCIARKANLLFAKNSLKKHCMENNIEFVEFEDFFQISKHLFKEGTTEDAKIKAKGEAFRG